LARYGNDPIISLDLKEYNNNDNDNDNGNGND